MSSYRYKFSRLTGSFGGRNTGARNSSAGNDITARIGQNDALETSDFKTWHDGSCERVKIGLQDDGSYGLIVRGPACTPIFSVSGGPSFASQIATQSTTSAALIDSDTLFLPMAASKVYRLVAMIVFQTGGGNDGITFSLNGPAGVTRVSMKSHVESMTAAGTINFGHAYNALLASTNVSAANTDQHGELSALIVNGATAGNLIFRFSSEAGTVTRIMPGSMIWLQEVLS